LRIQDGLREVLRPQVVLQNDKYIFVEADVDTHALRDLPDNPAGA